MDCYRNSVITRSFHSRLYYRGGGAEMKIIDFAALVLAAVLYPFVAVFNFVKRLFKKGD